ncbi:hypothetical protein B4N89_45490 [Embleya scabrispora]|uniref:Uncharacterized protein n=1 Tax=Embleya scabrispora TaxID=159449 RepID=A0A1T3NJE2_9ACTN|nr:hypothetical protein [Embleya scabrispora]OPC76741.1 hypothetical protein B4N89_45490 [Embleya scabrispora]
MSNRDRAVQVRTLAADLGRRFGVDVDAVHVHAGWRIEWRDGPTVATARAWTARRALDPAGAVSLFRDVGRRAWVVAAVRAAMDGVLWSGVASAGPDEARWLLERIVAEREYPDRVDGEREVLVDRLLAALPADHDSRDDGGLVGGMVAERGVSWLVEGEGLDVLSPAEVLTARYVDTRAEVVAWERSLAVLPARVLVERALADPGIDRTTALALVALLPALRVEWAATAAAIRAAAARAMATPRAGGSSGDRSAATTRARRVAPVYATSGPRGRVGHWLREGARAAYCGAVIAGQDRPGLTICRACLDRGTSPLQQRLRGERLL